MFRVDVVNVSKVANEAHSIYVLNRGQLSDQINL
jgi:hypothetical protein